MVRPLDLLRWQYLGRLTLAAGIFGGALLVWPTISPGSTLLATLLLLLALGVTTPSFWHTHVRGAVPSRNFLYGQAIFDVLLVTAVVHLTGGADSDFAPLYILVIASGALTLPLAGGILIGALASILYFGDVLWLHAPSPPGTVFVQIGLFAVMALVTGVLGGRLRRAGTELGAVELELRQLRLDTGDILGAIDTGVVTVDGAGRLMYMNPAAEGLLGMRGREWMGRPVLTALDRITPGLGTAIRRTASRRSPVRRYEAGIRGRAEEDRVLGVRTTLLEREDAPWVTAVFQDITDGKRVEALHRRTERLKAVAELAASLAHEIKNPLASIRSAVEQLAGERTGAEDRERLQRLVTTESDRLSRLLSEFIEFSRVPAERSGRVDLSAVVREAVELVGQHPEPAERGEIELDVPAEPVRVPGDEDLLHRVVFNLALNAIQHAGTGGRVRIGLSWIREVELPEGVQMLSPVRLTVRDSGPGIAPRDVPRIFDPFFTRREGGTGLGLALVHRAVQAHEGAVFVDRAPGGGAEFTIYFPSEIETDTGAEAGLEHGGKHDSEGRGDGAVAPPAARRAAHDAEAGEGRGAGADSGAGKAAASDSADAGAASPSSLGPRG